MYSKIRMEGPPRSPHKRRKKKQGRNYKGPNNPLPWICEHGKREREKKLHYLKKGVTSQDFFGEGGG